MDQEQFSGSFGEIAPGSRNLDVTSPAALNAHPWLLVMWCWSGYACMQAYMFM